MADLVVVGDVDAGGKARSEEPNNIDAREVGLEEDRLRSHSYRSPYFLESGAPREKRQKARRLVHQIGQDFRVLLVHDRDEAFPFSSNAIGIAVVLDEPDVALDGGLLVLRPERRAIDVMLQVAVGEAVDVLLQILHFRLVQREFLRLLQIMHHHRENRSVVAGRLLDPHVMRIDRLRRQALHGSHTQLQRAVRVLEQAVVVALHVLRVAVSTMQAIQRELLLNGLDVAQRNVAAVITAYAGSADPKTELVGLVRKDLVPAMIPEIVDGLARFLIGQCAMQDLFELFLGTAWNDLCISEATIRNSDSAQQPIVTHVSQDVAHVNQESINLLFRCLE